MDLPFSIGRKDCSIQRPDSGLPSGFQTNTIQLLRTQFNLSTREAVALIGKFYMYPFMGSPHQLFYYANGTINWLGVVHS